MALTRFVNFCKQSYTNNLAKRPILMQSVQTGILMGTGDVLAQTIIEKRDQFNYLRTVQFFGIGFFIGGPSLRIWYGFLDKNIRGTTKTISTVKKVSLDQLLFAPTFIALLISLVGKLQGLRNDQISTKLKNEFSDILCSNYLVWPWVQFVNFSLIPLNYQVLVVQVVAIFWNTYVSWRTNKTKSCHVE